MNRNTRFWEQVRLADRHLDDEVSDLYHRQPMAQDLARISKAAEEVGEAIGEFILWTGQNPRKGKPELAAYDRLLNELCDVVCTGILAIQHFTKDGPCTKNLIMERMDRICSRVGIEVTE